MPEFQNTNLKVLVANSEVGATETTLSDFKTSAANGETIAVEADGTAIASGSTSIKVLVKDSEGKVRTTEPIQVSGIKHVKAKAYVSDQEQVSYVGFNGTTGSIDVINDNLYQINLEFRDYNAISSLDRYRKQAHYQSAASASELAIAEGLRDSLIRNFSREPEGNRLGFEMVATTTNDLALGTGVDSVVFTKDSKYVTATDVDNATTNAALAVGDLLRVGTAATDAVYRITAIDTTANIITLDQKFQGDTVTVVDTGLRRIPAANLAAQDYGIKISGKPLDFKLGKIQFQKISFYVGLVDSGVTPVTNAQASSSGLGVGKRVAEAEWFALGNFGEMYRMGEPHLYDYVSQLEAVQTNKYDLVSITYRESTYTGFQDNPIQRTVDVYCNAGDGTDHTNANVLITDLNTLASVSVSTL